MERVSCLTFSKRTKPVYYGDLDLEQTSCRVFAHTCNLCALTVGLPDLSGIGP